MHAVPHEQDWRNSSFEDASNARVDSDFDSGPGLLTGWAFWLGGVFSIAVWATILLSIF
jgi:hypothetical protein